jgi:hypothetical protein
VPAGKMTAIDAEVQSLPKKPNVSTANLPTLVIQLSHFPTAQS